VRAILLLALVVAGCDRAPSATTGDSAGARLEAAAERAGIVSDPDAPLEGAWARDTDRLCVVGTGKTSRIGVSVDYGEDQGCAATGVAEREGTALRLTFGDCRIVAQYDGDRIVFPAIVADACQALCTGRATLAAVTVDRQSMARSEALTLRSSKGTRLCSS